MIFGKKDTKKLKGLSENEIIFYYLSIVQKSKNIPDLKILMTRTQGDYLPNKIIDSLEDLETDRLKNNKTFQKYLEKFAFEINKIKKNIFILRFHEIDSNLNFYYVIIVNSPYWTVLSMIKSQDLKRTYIRLVHEIRELEMIELTQNQLEQLVKTHSYREGMEGFTAKYLRENESYKKQERNYKNKNKNYQSKNYNGKQQKIKLSNLIKKTKEPEKMKDLGNEVENNETIKKRKLTFTVHGGSMNDLEKIRRLFPMEPTIINFRLKNSPMVQINAHINGFFAVRDLSKGGFKHASQVISDFKNHYINISKLYEEVRKYKNKPSQLIGKNGEIIGQILESEYILKMKIKKERFDKSQYDDYLTPERLNQYLTTFLQRNNKKYGFYFDEDYGYMVQDKEYKKHLQITIEKEDDTYSILIYPHGKCRPNVIEDLCTNISKKVESSYSEIKPYTFIY